MKRLLYLLSIMTFLLLFTENCGNYLYGDVYEDGLTFGTGVDSDDESKLTGETTTFSIVNPTIYFRLESQDDISVSAIDLKIEKEDATGWVIYNVFTYNSNLGHILLSSFMITQEGHYRAIGTIKSSGAEIASAEFDVTQ